MASYGFDHAKALLLKGDLDFDEAGNDIRVALLMTNTTADTEKTKTTLTGAGGFTTLDDCDGANYVRKALANQVVSEDAGGNRGEFSADAVTWTALGVGTRQVQGMLIYKFVTNDSDSIPIAWIDTGGFPFWGNGSDVTMTPNAQGLLQTT